MIPKLRSRMKHQKTVRVHQKKISTRYRANRIYFTLEAMMIMTRIPWAKMIRYNQWTYGWMSDQNLPPIKKLIVWHNHKPSNVMTAPCHQIINLIWSWIIRWKNLQWASVAIKNKIRQNFIKTSSVVIIRVCFKVSFVITTVTNLRVKLKIKGQIYWRRMRLVI